MPPRCRPKCLEVENEADEAGKGGLVALSRRRLRPTAASCSYPAILPSAIWLVWMQFLRFCILLSCIYTVRTLKMASTVVHMAVS